jgi:ESX-1-secreted protein regulator
LIATIHPCDRGPLTNKELAEAVQAFGVRCTPQYVGQLRASKHAPSLDVAVALGRAFGVPIDYFSDDDIARQTDEQLAFLAATRDAAVTKVALRAVGLSPRGLATLYAVILRIRAAEGLPPDPSDGQRGAGPGPLRKVHGGP